MTTEKQELAPVSDPPAPPTEIIKRQTQVTLTAWVTGPQGIALEVKIEGIVWDGDARGTAKRAIAFENALVHEGLTPTAVEVAPPASAAAAAPAAATAVELPGINGGPPICSLHGAMVQRQGANGSFWSCSNKVNGNWCRPKKQGAA